MTFDTGMATVNHAYCIGGEQTYDMYGGAYAGSSGTITLNLLGGTYTLAMQ